MLLKVKDLHIWFMKKNSTLKAVNGVSFTINENERVGLVGESGSGKSITALSLLRLVPKPGEYVKGEVWFQNKNLLSLSEEELYVIRGKQIAMIFQDPMTALNPVFTIGEQISEGLRYHFGLSKKEAKEQAIALLEAVGMPSAASRFNTYPHQLSGGMRQRVMIAMALALRPKLLIADEPTTALDVTIQAQILSLLDKLSQERQMSILFISHDLTVVAQIAQRVMVMYAGIIVETALTEELFKNPLHPYTQGLLRAIPSIKEVSAEKKRLMSIPGERAEQTDIGCPFFSRCVQKMPLCQQERPPLKEVLPHHKVACWLYA
jgi:oligopeptide/dipeptide ABC transporter ATP-binding protein